MSALLTFAGAILKPFAPTIFRKMSSWTGIDRYRVTMTVRSATGLKFPAREFRSWLKKLELRDFEEPVETAAPRLALSLDDSLAQSGDVWTRQPGRASASLKLVRATYGAFLQLVDDKKARDLAEHWAENRNDAVLARLGDLTLSRGGWGKLDGPDLSFYLQRRSWERRAIRLESVGVTGDLRHSIIEILQPAIPKVPMGAVRVLIGPYGSGKTEVAEAWHLAETEALANGSSEAIPIWLSARDIRRETVEAAVEDAVGSQELLHARGASIVIDGLDEVDGATAEAIAADARVLVAGSPRCRVLVTSRPHVLVPSPEDSHVSELDEDTIGRIVAAMGGNAVVVHTWPAALRTSAKRPFFALAAATAVGTGHSFGGQAGLIRHLVELALQRGTAQTVTTASVLFEALVQLATQITSYEEPEHLPFALRQQLLSTRLVNESPAGILQFSLPIFEQWFAAQQLVSDSPDVPSAFTDRTTFDRWRWAAAIALSGADARLADQIVTSALRLNPGAAGWLLSQISSGFSVNQEKPDVDFGRVGSRKLAATRAWVDSIGPLAVRCFPIDEPQTPIRLGLRISQNGSQTWGWSTEGTATGDEVVALPADLTPFGPPKPGWARGTSGQPPTGSSWPWLAVQQDVRHLTLKILESDQLLGGDVGVWATELMYSWCRVILDERRFTHPPMDRKLLLAKVEQLLELVENPVTSSFAFGRHTIHGENLLALRDWLKIQSAEFIRRPVPAPDTPQSQASNFIWDVYSDQHLVKFAAETYGNACQAYGEVATHTFAKFGWSLGRCAYAPIGVLGTVTRSRGTSFSDGPSVSYVQLPLEALEDIPSSDGYVLSANGRAAIRWTDKEYNQETYQHQSSLLQSWTDRRRRTTAPFGSLHWSNGVLHTNGDRLSSDIAANWLHSDLKSVSLSDGTFPQLNR
ncbi:hypothetical protein [Phycicoccus sp. Root563]|uniref:hypothetical protein n=1 Tax=Phycicoccus sp. Root563 TaxID=1736562 RepID=UPI000A4FBA79|nr:hypothetical protein [Phycicoccus sp. Root563]